MRKVLLFLAGLGLLGAWCDPAQAQCNGVFAPGTVCGNAGTSPAPPAQIPAAGLSGSLTVGTTAITGGTAGGLLFDQSGVLQNSGPFVGAISNPAANGQWSIGSSTASGAIVIGQGSTNDVTLENRAGAAVYAIATGTQRSAFAGALTAAVRSSAAATVTVSASADYFLCLDPTSNAIAVNLPASPPTGLTYLVKDCTGHAAAHNVTISPASGNVDGSPTFLMNTNYQSVGITYTGSQWSLN